MASLEEPNVDPVTVTQSPVTEQASAVGQPMTAVVIGATGAVGKALVGVLLKNKVQFGKVILVGRRKLDRVDEKYHVNLQDEEANGRLIQHQQDMDEINDETIQRICQGAQVFFCCLGTTRKMAGSAQRFHEIDHDIPLKFAKAAKAVGVSHYSLVSSFGAKATSMFLFPRTKGEIEEDIKKLSFEFTTILRPVLLGRGLENRRPSELSERIAAFFMKAMPVGTVAEAMAVDAYSRHTAGANGGQEPVVTTLNNAGIYEIASKSRSSGTSVDPPEAAQPAEDGKNQEELGDSKNGSLEENKDPPLEPPTTEQVESVPETLPEVDPSTDDKSGEDIRTSGDVDEQGDKDKGENPAD